MGYFVELINEYFSVVAAHIFADKMYFILCHFGWHVLENIDRGTGFSIQAIFQMAMHDSSKYENWPAPYIYAYRYI